MKTLECSPLLSSDDIEKIFKSSHLFSLNSFYTIDPTTRTYDANIKFESYIEYSTFIRKSFLAGETIIVKNLENFTPKIRMRCSELSSNVDVHMYLVPPEGRSSFQYHIDDRDVEIEMIYGEKDFFIKENEREKVVTLKKSDRLTIPKGTFHKAVPKGPSCLLSFGILEPINYDIPGGITQEDLF
ncbi:hypothetical protein [Halobacteriovorax sp. HLS]|uniref:hypothetical protein n=1 Tax=Halobacteriovorax sp. HLS TaxID=2234000 RepID=UPI000FDB272E|nr:hypothetical protein [Halobacteriovorax sp. HLS]